MDEIQGLLRKSEFRLERQRERLSEEFRELKQFIRQEIRRMATNLDDRLARLEAKMTALTTVGETTAALLDGLQAEVKQLRKDLASMDVSPEALARLDALDASLGAHHDKLVAAAEEGIEEPVPVPEPEPSQRV